MDARFSDLRMKITPVLRPYARRISVFGSFARGDSAEQSDIDLLVALKPAGQRPPLGLFGVIRLGHIISAIEKYVAGVESRSIPAKSLKNLDVFCVLCGENTFCSGVVKV